MRKHEKTLKDSSATFMGRNGAILERSIHFFLTHLWSICVGQSYWYTHSFWTIIFCLIYLLSDENVDTQSSMCTSGHLWKHWTTTNKKKNSKRQENKTVTALLESDQSDSCVWLCLPTVSSFSLFYCFLPSLSLCLLYSMYALSLIHSFSGYATHGQKATPDVSRKPLFFLFSYGFRCALLS